MSSDVFAELLEELGQQLEMELHVDKHYSCSLRISDRFTVQMQLDSLQERLRIVTKIFELPPGSFRELVLRDALKANDAGDFPYILGYYPPKNQLALFQSYPLPQLNGEKLANILGPFIAYAELWHEALSRGRSSP
jgi:hypothetical protein